MPNPFEGLEPQPVWAHFDAICKVPRPSKHEGQISRHVLAWAGERGFEARRDASGNLLVAAPASAGFESAPAVVLQAPLDMVCEKNAGGVHD